MPKDPSQLPTPTGGWNAAIQTVSGIERIPLEGLTQGLQANTARSAAEKAGESPRRRATNESENGKAIAIVPTSLKPDLPVAILLHLHGHNIGYRERSKAGDGMAQGSVRDVATDRIAQQIGASGRNMIGILPQGTAKSGFGAFAPDPYIAEVWGQLAAMKKLPPGAKRGAIVLSGHSGAAAPITRMLLKGNLPAGLGELVLFDAIHTGQRPPVETFLRARMAADVKALRDIADPTLNAGLGADAVLAQQAAYLAGSFRFRGVFTPKFHPQKRDANNQPMWHDPETKKKPVLDESVWKGYGVEYEPLREFIKKWIDSNTKGLAASLITTLRENYRVVPAGAGATHNTIMGANNNLQSALSVLPGARLAPKRAPSTPATTSKTGALEETFGVGSELASVENTRIHRQLQRQGASAPAALTDAQQWEQDWTSHPAQQHYFAGQGRPAGTPRQRYDVLCPLYKAQGIPRPMLYIATWITTARFYHFSTPAHRDMATALAAAESTLKGKGHSSAPVKSVWALNPRTTSTGAWSNHADGRAVDIDPDDNPHLVDKKARKIISLVSGVDMEKGGQGYDVLKGASDRFRADYNPAGLGRRITEIRATEQTKAVERDTAKSTRDTLKTQRDTLKTERDSLKKQLKRVPQSKKATASDVAAATALKARLQQIDTDLKQVLGELKQQEGELKRKVAELKAVTKDRELLEKQLARYQATEKAIADLENAVKALPVEIQSITDQISQSKQDETDARAAKDASGVRAQQKLRAKLQKALVQKKVALKKQQTQLAAKKKQRDADPLRKYAAGGFLNLAKDVVDALTGSGLRWGGNWAGAKDFMHFEL